MRTMVLFVYYKVHYLQLLWVKILLADDIVCLFQTTSPW